MYTIFGDLESILEEIQTPYFAPNPPYPLPTNLEIQNSPVLEDHNGYKVVRVRDEYVVKFGDALQLNLIEGENMIFVRESTKIKVPQIYALYTDDTDATTSTNYIVMEYIEGQNLATIWETLSSSEKGDITATLARYFTELRQLPSPKYFGALGKRPLLGGMFWTSKRNPAINGPFDKESELNEAFVLKYSVDYTVGSETQSFHKANFYRRVLSNVFQNHPPKFTHGDFQRKNVMVKRRDSDHSGGCDVPMYEVTLIDWETSGWLPSYWDYSMAALSTRWDDDWGGYLVKVLEPFDCELPWVQMLFLELWS